MTAPTDNEMAAVRHALQELGLNTVLAQTMRGNIGP
jgi:hypothetical protein